MATVSIAVTPPTSGYSRGLPARLIQQAWNPILAGHPTDPDTDSDTTLDGADVLSDVHVGRLTASSTGELSTIVDKILDHGGLSSRAPPAAARPPPVAPRRERTYASDLEFADDPGPVEPVESILSPSVAS